MDNFPLKTRQFGWVAFHSLTFQLKCLDFRSNQYNKTRPSAHRFLQWRGCAGDSNSPTGCNPNFLQLIIWKHVKIRQYIFLLMLFTYLHGPLGSHADFTYLLTGSKLRNLKTNFSLDLKTPQVFSNYPAPDIDYHQLFWISFWGKLGHQNLLHGPLIDPISSRAMSPRKLAPLTASKRTWKIRFLYWIHISLK